MWDLFYILQTFDGIELVRLIKKLVSIEADWVPHATVDSPSSLYIRPTSIGTEVKLESVNEPPHDKTNKMTVHPAKTLISLGIRQV